MFGLGVHLNTLLTRCIFLCLCLVTDCRPMIDDLDVLLGHLHKTHDWHQFLVSVRHRFSRLVWLCTAVAGRDWTIDIAGNAVIGCDHCPLRLHVTCSLTYLLSCINMTKFLASCCISAQQQQQQHHPFNSPLWQPRVSRYQNSVSCPIYHSHCPEISHNHSQTFLPVYNSLYNSAADCFGCWL